MPRLFVGLRVEDSARRRIGTVLDDLRAAGFGARYVDPADLHVTLAFLGQVDDAAISDLASALEEVAWRHAAFRLRFDRLGAFPDPGRPRVVWVGESAASASPPFVDLGRDVRAAYAGLGFSFPDELALHVTLCRADGRRPLPSVEVAPVLSRHRDVCLFESTNARPRYRILYTAALR